MSISNNVLIFYHTYTIESKKKSVYFTDFSIKTSFSLEYRDRFERLLGYQQDILAYCETGDPSSHAQLFLRGYRHTIEFLNGRTEAHLKALEEAEKAIAACRRRRLNQ